MSINKFPKTIISIHWLTFILLIISLFICPVNKSPEFNPQDLMHYRIQAYLAISLIILTVIRIFFKRSKYYRRPPYIHYIKPFHKKFIRLVNYLIYLFILIKSITAITIFYQAGILFNGPVKTLENIEFDPNLQLLNTVSTQILIILIVIHIAGVIHYIYKTGDNILKRMFY